jgi:diguanylate cyclase (GGDEF)-like protein
VAEEKNKNAATLKDKVFSEQVSIIHNNLYTSIPGNFICAIIVSLMLNHVNETKLSMYFFLATIAVNLFRLGGFYYYSHYPRHNKIHLVIFMTGLILSAALWGLIDSIFMPKDMLAQMIIMVIVAGVTAGGIQTLSASLLACVLYICIIVLPLIVWLLAQNSYAYHLLNAGIITYFIFMILTSIRGNKLLARALTLNLEKVGLIEKLSITNTKLLNAYKTQEKHEHKILLINKMNDMLQVCQNSEEAYAIIRPIGNELFPDFSGGLFILNSLNNKLESALQWGDENLLKPSFSITNCWALRKGKFYVNQNARDIACQHFQSDPLSSICLPLAIQAENMGLLIIYSSSKEILTREEVYLGNTFAEDIQLSLSNIKLRESLYEQSTHDPLTGLYNRRYLDTTLSREIQLTIREKKPLCVAMLDLDHFKAFNDLNGHEAGDEALRYFAENLQDNFRGTDISCRYGGEEFLIVLINSDLDSAKSKLEHFRNIIKKGKIHAHGAQLNPLSVSIGIAEAPVQGSTTRDIIHAADVALYSAKQLGRDRIECAKL